MCSNSNNRPFVAIFPKPPKPGDKLSLDGKLKDDAQIFSINFALGCDPTPTNIAYHFKTIFTTNREEATIHNYKRGTWGKETIEENTWINGPGGTFSLEFIFSEEDILVYSDLGFHYKFDLQFDLSEIQSVQIWDDLDYINELKFVYNNNNY